MQQWKAQGLGIKWITLLLDNQNEGPPDAAGAKLWRDNFGLTSVTVCADPKYSMVPGNNVGTPQNTVIDPRTMKVVELYEGYTGNYSPLTSLAQKNK